MINDDEMGIQRSISNEYCRGLRATFNILSSFLYQKRAAHRSRQLDYVPLSKQGLYAAYDLNNTSIKTNDDT